MLKTYGLLFSPMAMNDNFTSPVSRSLLVPLKLLPFLFALVSCIFIFCVSILFALALSLALYV